jgi:RNA polymerase sigma-70 factor (ECF subfamily)
MAEVALACRGDQSAFERLYRTHIGRIRGLARRMSGVDDADEVSQDVFIRAWEKLGTFRGASSFGTWLHRLAVNVIVERHRARLRHLAWLSRDDTVVERAAAGGRNDGFSIDFEAAVRRLPVGARQVFLLHDVEGYKHHEIGRMMGISTNTSKGQLHRARMILRRHLEAGCRAALGEVQRNAPGGSHT